VAFLLVLVFIAIIAVEVPGLVKKKNSAGVDGIFRIADNRYGFEFRPAF